MKWLITGGRGQLGSALTARLQSKPGETVVALGSDELDIRNATDVSEQLDRHQPAVVINTAAYNLVDRAEMDPKKAFEINAFAVRTLSRECTSRRIQLAHVSSNFVFDGRRRRPYRESDAVNPLNVYGLSKLAGEMFVRRAAPRHLIVRTSGLFGRPTSPRSKKNFVEMMLERAKGGQEIRVVKDQVLTPTSCADLAGAIVALVENNAGGTLHITNAGSCSWADFARTIFRVSKQSPKFARILTRSFGAPAERPLFTVLSNARYESLGLPPLRPWEDALRDYLRARQDRPS